MEVSTFSSNSLLFLRGGSLVEVSCGGGSLVEISTKLPPNFHVIFRIFFFLRFFLIKNVVLL